MIKKALIFIGIMMLPFVIPVLDYFFRPDPPVKPFDADQWGCSPCDCTPPDYDRHNFTRNTWEKI